MMKRDYPNDQQKKMQAPEDLVLDYKRPDVLKHYLKDDGSLLGRSRSGLTAKQQRALAREVKRARYLALLPFVTTI